MVLVILLVFVILLVLVIYKFMKNKSIDEVQMTESIGYSYVLIKYPYKQINNFDGFSLFNSYLSTIFPKYKHHIENVNNTIFEEIGKNKTVWGFQFNLDTQEVDIEYYFYRGPPRWSNNDNRHVMDTLSNIFNKHYVFNIVSVKTDFYPGMISIDIPLTKDSNINKIDIYNIKDPFSGYCIEYSKDCIKYKNTYKFFIDNDYLKYINELGIPESCILLKTRKWTFSICIAKKINGNYCIYFSGITINQILEFIEIIQKYNKVKKKTLTKVLNKFIKPIADNLHNMKYMLFDIGYDFTIDDNNQPEIHKLGIYSWM